MSSSDPEADMTSTTILLFSAYRLHWWVGNTAKPQSCDHFRQVTVAAVESATIPNVAFRTDNSSTWGCWARGAVHRSYCSENAQSDVELNKIWGSCPVDVISGRLVP